MRAENVLKFYVIEGFEQMPEKRPKRILCGEFPDDMTKYFRPLSGHLTPKKFFRV